MTVTVDDVRYVVGRHFQIPKEIMLSADKKRGVSRPRQIAMTLAREMAKASFPKIGRAFGGRDHSTAIHALNRVREVLECEPELAPLLESLREQIRLQDALKPRIEIPPAPPKPAPIKAARIPKPRKPRDYKLAYQRRKARLAILAAFDPRNPVPSALSGRE